jgi:dCMP deaminase
MTDRTWSDWKTILQLAYHKSTASSDPSTQNAAVLVHVNPDRPGGGTVISHTWAINDLPRGVASTPEKWEKPLKYAVVEHAERNSIYAAARLGVTTAGLAMVCPWQPCTDCARAVIQAGVTTLVTHQSMNDRTPESWAESIATARGMLAEAGVNVIDVSGPVNGPQVLHTGVLWTP